LWERKSHFWQKLTEFVWDDRKTSGAKEKIGNPQKWSHGTAITNPFEKTNILQKVKDFPQNRFPPE